MRKLIALSALCLACLNLATGDAAYTREAHNKKSAQPEEQASSSTVYNALTEQEFQSWVQSEHAGILRIPAGSPIDMRILIDNQFISLTGHGGQENSLILSFKESDMFLKKTLKGIEISRSLERPNWIPINILVGMLIGAGLEKNASVTYGEHGPVLHVEFPKEALSK